MTIRGEPCSRQTLDKRAKDGDNDKRGGEEVSYVDDLSILWLLLTQIFNFMWRTSWDEQQLSGLQICK